MSRYTDLQEHLRDHPRRWLVTGGSGFIGANITLVLLRLGQHVTVLDNLSTGDKNNLTHVQHEAGDKFSKNLVFIEGDIRDSEACKNCCKNVQYVLHQAALGSVPRSVNDPWATHDNNVNGFMRMLLAARDAGVERFVYASSSSVYGDEPSLPKVEGRIGQPLSPYALTKRINEEYAQVFERAYGFGAVGLRYFNVFGPMQSPNGPYAAVIPRWIDAIMEGKPVQVHGDGMQSRDFCYVANAVQANLLAAAQGGQAGGEGSVYNVAYGKRATLMDLLALLKAKLAARGFGGLVEVEHGERRAGDVAHSLADIGLARARLGYEPGFDLEGGLEESMGWYVGGK